jgi:serine phosphatase RsbU (regulator of sigma subunit)
MKLTYRLLGYEKNWKQRDYLPQIEYPMLPPGHYEFQIYGTSPIGKKAKPISVFFSISPPFYATWWAYLIYIIALLFSIRGIYKLRTRQLKLRNLALEKTVAERTQEVIEKQKHIQESINYAFFIQKSTLPQDSDMADAFASHFVLWQPKATVGGDFYWLHKNEKGDVFFAVIDCTGHGVPGALLSMTVSSLLNHLIKDIGMDKPSAILQTMHQEFGAALHQENPEAQQDGVEISLLKITKELITFCGAGLNLVYYDKQSQTLNQVRGDRYGLGGLKRHRELELTEHNLPYSANLLLYLYTDGIIDQPVPDSEKIKRLGNALWLKLISELVSLPLAEQKTLLAEKIKAMLDFYEQRDDITIVGLQL